MRRAALAIMLALPIVASAQDLLRYGSWRVDIQEASTFIFVANQSGSQLGNLCSRATETCLFYFVTDDTTCEADAEIPVLLNASNGAENLIMRCAVVGKGKALVFKNYEAVDRAIQAGGELGIAFPLKSGKFQVSRFNTDQYAKAYSVVVAIHKSTSPGARDVKL